MHVNSSGLHRIEHGIRPPMGKAITLTVGRGAGIAIYVATPAFGDSSTSDAELIQLASSIATLLERLDPPTAPKVRRASPRAHVRRTATGWTFVGSVESDSEPNVDHKIKRNETTGALGCDCMAYRFARGEKTCKHLDAYRETDFAGMTQTDGVSIRATPTETFTVRRGISFDALTK